MLLEIERECLEVYWRKVDEACKAKAQLHQSVAAKEAELSALMASLGEHTLHMKKEKKRGSLKEQLASLAPLLEDLRAEKEERVKQFADIRSQIEKISAELTEHSHQNDTVTSPVTIEEHDLSMGKLDEYQARLRALQKEKCWKIYACKLIHPLPMLTLMFFDNVLCCFQSGRLHKVLEYINEVHSLCGVLGLDFRKTVDEAHPSLHETGPGQSTNISNYTLEGLAQAVLKLKAEKKVRIQKLREIVESLFELWNLMDSSEQERKRFGRLTCIIGSPEQDITYPSLLSQETIEQTEAEVERLKNLKASRMKELILKKRSELEEICRRTHIEPDMSTAPEKTNALIDSGLVDPSELLADIGVQILKAKEESMSRKEIMDRISKWLAACDEETWLEEYNQDQNRYSARRGAHLNLKRAEKARITVRLVPILEEYKLTLQQKEDEKRRYQDQKKLQNTLLTEKEALFGSKPSPKRSISFNRKPNVYGANGNGNRFMPPTPWRLSVGSATPELLTPRTYSGHHNGYFKETRRLSTTPLNFVALSKEDTMSSFTSISGSEPESPQEV
ncbi:65-kDa microtubule-associated protein 6 [Cocos nucifera]|uniref:65-kDa microtubule-associated protein 6 n=1 Tax=Cocos nucifera TaxID=13894 RepID=A0A8K0N5Z8_COCNU|nr:65-kDa microtubule-associated protein 6 [Cocos nucifera]